VSCLQDVSNKAEETSKANTGDGKGLLGTRDGETSWGGGGLGRGGSNNGGLSSGGWDGGDSWDGGVLVHWDNGGADSRDGGHSRGDGARAVGDGDGLRSSGGVGNAVEGERGGCWADGGVHINDLGNVGDVGFDARLGSGNSGQGGESDDGELHLDG